MDLGRLLVFALLAFCAVSCTPVVQPLPEHAPVAAVEAKPLASEQGNEQVAYLVSESGPAGIVLYCLHQGEIHLLLANDRLGMRGWGGFMGGNKKGETAAMTAAREAHEETRGYYATSMLLHKISNQQPVKQWGCYLYFAEVAHVPVRKIMDHPIPLLRPAYMETQHYAWVPFREIEPLLTKQTLTEADLRLDARHLQRSSRSNSYWRVWIDNMRQLQLKDAFPWSR